MCFKPILQHLDIAVSSTDRESLKLKTCYKLKVAIFKSGCIWAQTLILTKSSKIRLLLVSNQFFEIRTAKDELNQLNELHELNEPIFCITHFADRDEIYAIRSNSIDHSIKNISLKMNTKDTKLFCLSRQFWLSLSIKKRQEKR